MSTKGQSAASVSGNNPSLASHWTHDSALLSVSASASLLSNGSYRLPQVSSWVVYAGIVTRSSAKMAQHTGYAVEKIIYSKNYNHRSHDSDIALMKLRTPLNFSGQCENLLTRFAHNKWLEIKALQNRRVLNLNTMVSVYKFTVICVTNTFYNTVIMTVFSVINRVKLLLLQQVPSNSIKLQQIAHTLNISVKDSFTNQEPFIIPCEISENVKKNTLSSGSAPRFEFLS